MWRRKQQPPPPTYEDVRLVAEVLSRINADLIERHFAVSADVAEQFMDRLVAEECFGDLQPDGWHYPPVRKLRLRRTRRKPKVTNKVMTEEGFWDRPESVEDLTERTDELEQERYSLRATIKRLQDAGKTVIEQREQWKARAIAAEEQMATERDRHASGQDRFDALRRLIAKELHPDFCTGGQLEKAARVLQKALAGDRTAGRARVVIRRDDLTSVSWLRPPDRCKTTSRTAPRRAADVVQIEFAIPILTVV